MELSNIGVKPAKAKQFEKRGIHTVEDLLQYLPRKYKDYSHLTGLLPSDQVSCFEARVDSIQTRQGQKVAYVVAVCTELKTGATVYVRWFNTSWVYSQIRHLKDHIVYVIGKVEYSEQYKNYTVCQPEAFEIKNCLRIYPVYKSVPGMSTEYLSEKMNAAINVGILDSEILPTDILHAEGQITMPVALRYIHAPITMQEVEKGQKRILFNDLTYFAIQNELNQNRISAGSQYNIRTQRIVSDIIKELPFKLTDTQKNAVCEMLQNAREGRRINALVQGDVGSGKTIVCALTAAAFADNGYQAVIMAPTQVLARQHYEYFTALLKPYGISVAYLDSSLAAKDKKATIAGIADGSFQIVVGTHACVDASVTYKELALTIVDEEHRFGVKQKTAIIEKAAKGVHSITMSATPIPRTQIQVAQMVYGSDIQLYTISKPAERKEVKTTIFRNPIGNMRFILKEVKAGHQAYVVCPMIEQNDKTPDVKSVEEVSKEYIDFLAPHGVRIETLVGKDSKERTEEVIGKFKDGKIDVLIATTVIEVGVDVPNATVMIITNAERFGLSSLHQLRGRVGRSNLQSYCVLQSDDETPKGLARLQVMCETTDGFKIADADLKLRGAGDLLGTQQSGENKYVSLMLANPEQYAICRKVAKELINRGPNCCKMMRSIMQERESGGIND